MDALRSHVKVAVLAYQGMIHQHTHALVVDYTQATTVKMVGLAISSSRIIVFALYNIGYTYHTYIQI